MTTKKDEPAPVDTPVSSSHDANRAQEINELKEVEWYGAMVNTWVNTRMERDKSLLTLSTAGIGVLVTVVLKMGMRNISMLLLYILSLLAFIFCLFSVLWILKRNATHLEAAIQGKDSADPVLTLLDWMAMVTFAIGVLSASLMAVSSAIDSLFFKG